MKTASERQVGGNHYSQLPIQPMRYSLENGLNAAQHTAIKYITRYNLGKDDPLKELNKAIHTLELLIEIEGLRKGR